LDTRAPTEEERRLLVQQLAHGILQRIDEVSTVTPSAVLAFCLLCHRRRGMTEEWMFSKAQWILQWIRRRPNVRFSNTLSDVGHALTQAATRFSHDGLITIQDTGFEVVYSPIEQKRLAMDYYRNNLIHHFAPAAVAVTALDSFTVDAVPVEAFFERIRSLASLFVFEFLFCSKSDIQEEMRAAIEELTLEGIIRQENGFIVKVADAEEKRAIVRSVLEHFIEAYWLTAKSLLFLIRQPLSERELQSRALKLGDALYVRGDILFSESLSREVINNALRYFTDSGVVESIPGEGRHGPMLSLTAVWRDEPRLIELADGLQRILRR
jgi:glycerol-3-phosphate O-acyltransferase